MLPKWWKKRLSRIHTQIVWSHNSSIYSTACCRSLEVRKDQSSTSRPVSHIERDIKTKESGIEDKENALIPFDEKISQTSKRVDHLNHQIEKVTKERDQKGQ